VPYATVMTAEPQSQVVRITFVDVGQGDCTLIHLPSDEGNERAILVDCPTGQSRTVTRLLDHHRISTLELVVITHSHEDHAGGIRDVLDNFMRRPGVAGRLRAIKEVAYLRDTATPGRAVRHLHDYLADLNDDQPGICTEPRLVTRRYAGTSLQFIHPDLSSSLRAHGCDLNLASQIVLLEHAGVRVLLASDMTESAWARIAERERTTGGEANDSDAAASPMRAHILRYPHHGGEWPRTDALIGMLRVVQPRYIVISAGTRNTYQHPTQQAFDALRAIPSIKRVMCTQATSGQCGANPDEPFHCASHIEITIGEGRLDVIPSVGEHLVQIRKLRSPSCVPWLPPNWASPSGDDEPRETTSINDRRNGEATSTTTST